MLQLLLLFGGGRRVYEAGSLDSHFSPRSRRPQRDLELHIPCSLNFASGNPRFYFLLFFFYLWDMRRWTSINAGKISSKYSKPQTGMCHRQRLLLLKCCKVYKHAKKEPQYLVFSFTTTVGKSTKTIPYINLGFETWWFRVFG